MSSSSSSTSPEGAPGATTAASTRRRGEADVARDDVGSRRTLTTNYMLNERVFAPLAANDERVRRRNEVRRFRVGVEAGDERRPCWNASTKDELHPFPQPPLMHTNACYNGVDVVGTHFPESVPHSAFLRTGDESLHQTPRQSPTAARHTCRGSRYRFHCAALDDPLPPLSYLAQKIVEDAAPAKTRLRQGWCASTHLTGHLGNRFLAPPREPNYTELNQRKTHLVRPECYIAPQTRVAAMNASMRTVREQRSAAATQTLLTPYERADAPRVFKMSNIDDWWSLDPVRVAAEQTALRQALQSNPFSPLATTASVK